MKEMENGHVILPSMEVLKHSFFFFLITEMFRQKLCDLNHPINDFLQDESN